MNILFDARVLNYEFTGVAKTLLYLYRSCHEIDNEFWAYGFNCSSEDRNKFKEYGIELIGNRSHDELSNFARRYNIEGVHYPYNNGVRKRILSLPQVLSIHDLIPLEENMFKNPIKKYEYIFEMKRSIKWSDQVVTVSEYSKKSVIKFTHGKVEPIVIRWGVTLPDVNPIVRRYSYSYFLYVGGYDGRKGIDIIVETYMQLYSEGLTQCKLILTGKVHTLGEKTDRLINAGVKKGCIVQTGYVSDEEICGLYTNAVCSLYLSKAEGFGLPLIESMRYGCPIVTTKNTSIPEIGGVAACYVDRDNMRELRDIMLKMENDEAFREKYIVEGFKNIKRFSWIDSGKRFLNILNNLKHGETGSYEEN